MSGIGVRVGSLQKGIRDSVLGDQQLVYFPFRLQPTLGEIRSAPIGECPDQPLVLGPVLGHSHLEHKPSSARVEVRRLALIAVAEIKAVLGAERDVDFLVGVPVLVAEVKRERPVGIAFPAIKRGTYILASMVLGAADTGFEHASGRRPRQTGEGPRKRPLCTDADANFFSSLA